MEHLELNTQTALALVEGAWLQLSALAVSYSFRIIGAIILLIAGFIVARVAHRWAHRALLALPGFDETLARFLSNIVRYGILLLVGVTVLAQFGVQTASILAALGAIGLAIGLALQGTLQNIAAGVMLLVLRPFRIGEYIQTAAVSGTVLDVGLFATELRTGDGLYVLSPNSELWKGPITNTSRNPTRQTDITIGIGYGDDVDLALSTMLELAGAEGRVLPDPKPTAFVAALAPSTVDVTLRYWTRSPDQFGTSTALTKAVKLAFDQRGISMPPPQQEVTYRQTGDPQPHPARAEAAKQASS